ncbi:hypothetical protein B7P43_G07600 [Cryptotermes secundus]|uniref:Reverse transcriptase Ty1/copia-type domain-containing protein n=1 Tax=Cryptotermes secundus TaxID=105785 RepID=A0A2J7QI22_9NEOP|nr:hypothetical protein B7P43_G07600 [Cryptotermes secundus]
MEKVTDPEDKPNTPDQEDSKMQQEPEADNNEEEPTDTEEDEENENADHKDNGRKNNRQDEHGYELRPRRNIQMHPKYRDYHTGSQKEGMLTYTYGECMESEDSEKWKKAIKEEKDSLYQKKTWIYVNREKAMAKKILTSKWVFKIKDDGRHKARLVVRGCQQKDPFAAAECCKELKYLKTLIEELTGKRVEAELCADNQSAIKLIESGKVMRRSKHIDVAASVV